MDAIIGLNTWLDTLAIQLQPSQRRELMRRLAQGMRVRMRDRIKQQRDPDGNRFIPRKRDQIGKLKRQGAMFKRIGRDIKTEYSPDHAAVGFGGRTATVARVHQLGLVIKPSRLSKPTRYARRELVGFGEDDVKWIEQQIQGFLTQPNT